MSQVQEETTVHVDELHLGRVYAEALWNLAVQHKVEESLVEELNSLVKDVLEKNPELKLFFQVSSISQSKRESVLKAVFLGRASELLYNFLMVLNRHDRLHLIAAVAEWFVRFRQEQLGQVPVLVRTAVPLEPSEQEAVAAMVAKRFQIKPELRTEVDPDLLGGLWLKVQDIVYDRTVRSNLNRLRDNIRTRKSHEVQSGRDYVDHSEGN